MDPDLDHSNQQICPVVKSAPVLDRVGSCTTLDLLNTITKRQHSHLLAGRRLPKHLVYCVYPLNRESLAHNPSHRVTACIGNLAYAYCFLTRRHN
jgi:hypothetical protein